VGWVLAGLAALGLMLAAVLTTGRYGVLLPQTRLLIEARTDGLKLGRFGRLKIEGIEGDIWRRFTVRRLTISDEGGVWLEADHLAVQWRYAQLLRRRLDVDSATARRVRVLRQPTFDRKGVSQGMPLSVQIDKADARVEMLPAFSRTRGVYDVALRNLTVERGGGARMGVAALSVLHPGDHLKVGIDLGRNKALLVQAEALEARGGAIAGALGLAPDQSFSLIAHADGTTSAGRLAMVARSGQAIPVRAQGAWNPKGGAVSAHLLLSASRLTRYWERRLGPQAQISVIGRRRPDGLYDFDIRTVADNFTLSAKGPVNPGQRRALGLRATADIRELNPLLSVPKMGRGRISGLVTGPLGDLRLTQGQVAIWDIVDGDYRLPLARGPGTARFHDRQLDFETTLTGVGGVGPLNDWHRVVLGPAPRAKVAGSLLKDGRFLFRSIDAAGKNMRATGTGSRGVFGQLDFKGKLELISLAGARRGSGGSAQMSWLATQRDPEAPWNITLEGAGDRFALGYAEIDRLMGPSPRFKMQGAYLDRVFTVSKMTVDGTSADIEGSGVRAPDGQLKLTGTWTAQGPFGAGPVEITGKMSGKGVITGTLEAPKADLLADFETLALPRLTVRRGQIALAFVRDGRGQGVGGMGLTGDSDYGPARAKAAFRFAPGGVDLQDMDADLGGVKARGALTLRDNSPSRADLVLDIGPGALLTSGRVTGTLKIVDAAGGPAASVRLQTSGAAVRDTAIVLDQASFAADGPLSRLPYTIQAKGDFRGSPLVLDGSGFLSEDKARWTVAFNGSGQVRASRFKTAEPMLVSFGGGETSARMRLELGGGRAAIDARQTRTTMAIKAALQGVDIGFISEDFAGRFDADLTLDGQGERLTGSLDARLDDARSRDAGVKLGIDGRVKAVLTDNRMTVDAAVTSDQGLKSSASLVLSTEASAAPFRIAIARNQPLQGRIDVDGEVQPLWDLFLGGERTVGGRLTTQATLGGTFNDPKLSGQAALQGGRFEDYATGLRLRNLEINADLRSDAIVVQRFAALDPESGTVSGSGRVSLNRGGGSDFSLKLARFRLIDNDTASADASGEVTVTRGADGRIKIVGGLAIEEANINAGAQLAPSVPSMDVVEVNRRGSAQRRPAPAAKGGVGAALDVRLTAPRRIFVRGRGLDVEMSLAARVTGSTSAPVLDGRAQIVRGSYEFAGKRFLFDDRGAVQLSTDPNLIRLDLNATREDPSLTAVIRILGTAANPEITLTSTPVLPNDEVLSQVLFGRSASQLSPLEAAQLAAALTSLATGGGFDVIGGLRSFAGLDRLALAGGGETAVSVAGGKYLTDNVYLELAGGGRDGPSAEVDYRVNRRLSIISRLSSLGGAKLAVRWRRDLGRSRR